VRFPFAHYHSELRIISYFESLSLTPELNRPCYRTPVFARFLALLLPQCLHFLGRYERWKQEVVLGRLTKRVVDAAEPAHTDYFIWDGDLPAFGVRVLPSGRKTYVLVPRRPSL
jgi:hypothetical protein